MTSRPISPKKRLELNASHPGVTRPTTINVNHTPTRPRASASAQDTQIDSPNAPELCPSPTPTPSPTTLSLDFPPSEPGSERIRTGAKCRKEEKNLNRLAETHITADYGAASKRIAFKKESRHPHVDMGVDTCSAKEGRRDTLDVAPLPQHQTWITSS